MKKLILLLLFIPFICFGQEDIDYSSENSVRKYFDDNGTELFEGIWQQFGECTAMAPLPAPYKIAIVKEDGKFIGRVFSLPQSRFSETGTVKYVLETTASEGLLTIDYTTFSYEVQGQKFSTTKYIASVKSNTLIQFSTGECILKLIKTYPSLDKQKRPKSAEWAGNGSGIIISKSGYIVTNHHVIENADDIDVEFIVNGEVRNYNAEVVQKDPRNDLAIIKIVDINFDGLKELSYNFKTSSSDVGTKIYTFGYPKALSGMGKEIKVTEGIISSKSGIMGDITTYQITAPIQGGNSGGPLFDDKGNLIGINSSKFNSDETENVNYSIKSSYILNLIDVMSKNIDLPSNTKLQSLPLTEQIKEISKYVILIKVK